MDEREKARKAYEHLRLLADATGLNDQTRLAARTSEWAPANGKQWREINKEVTTDMVKQIWPSVSDEQIRKGRLKLDRCNVPDICTHAEAIYLACTGSTLNHTDCPLWFAKMLYMQYVLDQPVDFSSRTPNKAIMDIRSETVTVSREELRYALNGASMQTHDAMEELQTQLRTAAQPSRADTTETRELQRDIKLLRRELRDMEDRFQQQSVMTLIEHPNTLQPPPAHQTEHGGGPCPVCGHFFHSWSGHYIIACGHMYHLPCLMQNMVNKSVCYICAAPIDKLVYAMFKMEKDYERLVGATSTQREVGVEDLNLSL